MKKNLLFLFIILMCFYVNAQNTSIIKQNNTKQDTTKQVKTKSSKVTYTTLIKEAWKAYELKEYKSSALKYKEAFNELNGKAYPNDRYNASCSYALATNSKMAFYHLFRLANDSKYSNLKHITKDTDLNSLHEDKRWNKLISIVEVNKKNKEKDLDKELVAQLNEIYIEDQKYRNQISKIQKIYGFKSNEMKAHWNLIHKKDTQNLKTVVHILDTRGWLGENVVGGKGNMTLFLVIQHADIKTQLKYLPMMREAVKLKNASASSLALLEDRVALREGKRQIYGSQIHKDKETGELYVAALVDPENVDKRRAEVGLGTISDYINNWNLIWDVKKHIKRTEIIEAEKKK